MSDVGNDVDLIAVVGASCRLPGAEHPAALWDLVRGGREAIGPLSVDRAALVGESPGRAGGWLEDVAGFDAGFFGISHREAVSMDPQQRLGLELAQHALESAGLTRSALENSPTGVFVGNIWTDYSDILDSVEPDSYDLTGVARGIIANRISYVYGLRGPSLSVDCGQSSSLVAVHLAAESLRRGESEIAIAGGVNLILAPISNARSMAAGGMSPNGRCHTFDERADGYVRGEGGSLVVLKRLDRAMLDGDRVLAVIAGSAVGNDGTTSTLMTPSESGQEDVVRTACARSGIEPSALQYVELHGTGTPVGDPLEAAALGRVAGCSPGRHSPLLVGSVKTNIGHLEGAAGIAGFLKTVLALHHGEIPASLNFRRPPASIPLEKLGLRVATDTVPWPGSSDPDGRRYAGVSSFGMGGTNCHIVLTEAPTGAGPTRVVDDVRTATAAVPWALSARSTAALAAVADAMAPLANSARSRTAVAGALARRDAFEHRAVVLTAPDHATDELLRQLAEGELNPHVVSGDGPIGDVGGPVFVFPGQGAQWVGMGRALLESDDPMAAAFTARLEECSRALISVGGPDAFSVLSQADPEALADLTTLQPLLWAVMVSLAGVWMHAGVRPSAVIGHSQGEVAAAVVCGALTLVEGARVITARSSAMNAMGTTSTGMLSVALGEAEVSPRLAGTTLVIGAVNSPKGTVLTGDADELDSLAADLATEDIRARRLHPGFASHCPAVDPFIPGVVEAIGVLAPAVPRIPWLSTTTTDFMTAELLADTDYWVRNLREQVRFSDGVVALLKSGRSAFIECSSHPVLVGAIELISHTLERSDDDVAPTLVGTLRREDGGAERLHRSIAEAWVAGVDVDWTAFTTATDMSPLPPYTLPLYPFRHRKYWPEAVTGSRPVEATDARGATDAATTADGVGESEANPTADRLRQMSYEAAHADVLTTIVRTTAALVSRDGGDPSAIDADTTFRELGVDSVMSVELRTAIGRAVGMRLTTVVLFDHPTPGRLAGWLVSRLRSVGGSGSVGGSDGVVGEGVSGSGGDLDDPVVVVSVGCRFPGGVDSPESLWDVVSGGRDVTSVFPVDRGWSSGLLSGDPDAVGRVSVDRGGFLGGAAEFDAGFFGISPREALAMDPQQRVLLECAWEALERGGIDFDDPVTTAVFLGAVAQDYGPRMENPDEGLDGYLLTGNTSSVVSGRISYVLGLEGPAVTVDTACSSSLVALHLAMRSLRDGESDRALVGGATIMATPGIFVEFSRQRGLAADGRCKPFAAAADGTGWSEGAGVVVLERLSTAQAAGHRVLAVVRGSAVNSDGASNGLSAPNGVAQQRVIRSALASAGIQPADVDALEAHGTGTTLGDPIEAHALMSVFGTDREEPLSVGSVKSVLGHTQAAAGIAGLLTMILAMSHEELPATLHVDKPTPHVDWEMGAVTLRTEATPWPRSYRPRIAGVSAFGISGTNAHVILEEPPRETVAPTEELDESDSTVSGSVVPWIYSAADDDRLNALAERLTELPAEIETTGIATALTRRPAHAHRAVMDGAGRATVARGVVLSGVGAGVVFVFPGQGAQWVGMGAELLGVGGVVGEVFRARLVECSVAVVSAGGPDVVEVLGSGGSLDDVGVVQPVSWAVMVALAAVWESVGVVPAAVVGHSQGEIAAAVVAGGLSVVDGARVVVSRAAALRSVAGLGLMASVGESESVVVERIGRCGVEGDVGVAVVNSPGSVVVSGSVSGVESVVASAAADGVRVRVLPVDYASHSSMVDGVVFDSVGVGVPGVRWMSSVDGGWVRGELGADYWRRNVRLPVRFGDAVSALVGEGFRLFVEVSAHPVLVGAVVECGEAVGVDVVACGSLRRGEGGVSRVVAALGEAWVCGVGVDWSRLVGGGVVPVGVPTYPFHRTRYWASPATSQPVVEDASDPVSAELWAAIDNDDVDSLGRSLELDPQSTLADLQPALVAWRNRRNEERLADRWRYDVAWQPLSTPDDLTIGRVLVIAAADEQRDDTLIDEILALTGGTCHRVVPGDPTGTLSDIVVEGRPDVVLSLLGLRSTPAGQSTSVALTATIAALRSVVDATSIGDDGEGTPRLWTVTRAAVSVSQMPSGDRFDDVAPDPLAAQVWGLGRVAALEHPDRWGGLIDLPAHGADDVTIGDLASHIVGVTARHDDEDQVAIRARGTFGRRLRRSPVTEPTDPPQMHGTALVTGGTGALGGHIARRLVGVVDHVVLMSRRGEDAPDADPLRTELESLGLRVTLVASDVADPDAVVAVVEQHQPNVVVHAAGAAALSPIAQLTTAEVEDIIRAKVAGAENLDAALGDRELDAFVLFSSISGVWGVADHGAYAAANAHLDALAARRTALGRTALSVAWGPWAGGGMIASSLGDILARRGVSLIDPAPALTGLMQAIRCGDSTIALADVDWAAFAPVFTSSRRTRLLDELADARAAIAGAASVPEARDAQRTALARQVCDASLDEGHRIVDHLVRSELAAVLGHDSADDVDADRAFSDIGVDSLGAVSLRRALRDTTGVAMATTVVFDHPTPGRLAGWLVSRLRSVGGSGSVGGSDGVVGEGVSGSGGDRDDPVVVVSVGCRFPGGVDSPESLWDVVSGGRDVTSGFPVDRGWSSGLLSGDPDAVGRVSVDRGGFLGGAAEFDAGFFGISPREALAMDPQQRVLLECAWEALERGGIDPRSMNGSRTGVYIGLGDQDYARLLRGNASAEAHLATGAASSVASGRISYVLGLEGPAVTVDTACSSSLVALHLAMRSLRDGECDQALVGGAMVMANPDQFIRFSRQRALAPDGRCKPFAAAADGFALAEGAAVVLVERLSVARAAGHHVLAVVRGSAVNSDGASNGLSSPSGPAQQRVMRAALDVAGLVPSDIDVVEAHGTGTELGDPIEAGALLEVFGTDRTDPLWLGSIKSNLGHTQTVAGLAGVIKMVLAMAHEELPATLHVDKPTPHVDWESGNVALLRESRSWPRTERPRRAGVSAFGISGTNAHVILEEPPRESMPAVATTAPAHVDPARAIALPISARDAESLMRRARELADHLDAPANLAAVSSALSRRTEFSDRAVVLTSSDGHNVGDSLRALAVGQVPATVARGVVLSGVGAGVVFVFPGQGAQWVGMGAELLGVGGVVGEVFRARLVECSVAVVSAGGPDVVEVLGSGGSLDDVGVVQPVSWAVMVALAAVWESVGVVPAAVVGHSQGEIAAAVVAGGLSVVDGARVVVSRAAALRSVAGLGLMASVGESESVVVERIGRCGVEGDVGVAVVNSPGSVVVSGSVSGVESVVASAAADGVRVRVLPVDYASHSSMVDGVVFDSVGVGVPGVRWMSSVDGGWVRGELGADYWRRNVRLPVRFGDAVSALVGEGFRLFVEVSAHPVLVGAVVECGEAVGVDVVACGSLRRGEGGVSRVVAALGEAWVCGVGVDWSRLVGGGVVPVGVPTYPFHRTRYWPEPSAAMSIAKQQESGWHHRITWRPMGPPDTASVATVDVDPWVLVVPAEIEDSYAVYALRSAISSSGRPDPLSVIVDTDVDREDLAARLAAVVSTPQTPVVSLLGLPRPGPRNPGFTDRVRTAQTVILTQALADAGVEGRWWWLTHGAVATSPCEAPDAAAAQLWGLGLVVGLDEPVRWGGIIDLGEFDKAGAAVCDDITAAAAVAVIGGATGEDQVAIRNGRTLVRRLVADTPPVPSTPWTTSGTALVTGGTGALGGHVARWLADSGTERLVLASRRGPDAPGVDDLVESVRAHGLDVDVVACDLTRREGRTELERALAGHTVRTVVHAAGIVGAEASLADRTLHEIDASIAIKAGVAEYLDTLVGDSELDAFVLFSSGAASWGGARQAGYAAANAHLDALAARRRAGGRIALSVAWGAWANGGMVDDAAAAALRHRGVTQMEPRAAVAALAHLLAADGGPTAVVSEMNWGQFLDVYTASRPRRLLDDHAEVIRLRATDGSTPRHDLDEADVDAATADPAARLRERLTAAASDAERTRIAVDLVRRTAAAALGHDSVSAVGAARSFSDLGFESVTAVDFRNRLAGGTGVRLAAAAVYDHPSPQRLAAHLLETLGTTTPAEDIDGPASVEAMLTRLESLLDDPDRPSAAVAARLRDLADRINVFADASSFEGVDEATGPVDPDLESASDDEIFDLIDNEFGMA